MSTELLFESRLMYHVLHQDTGGESAPFLSLQLVLTDAPTMYASDAAIVNKAAWRMVIHRQSPELEPAALLGTIAYDATHGKPACVIDVFQSPERFAALLEMFKGGHASEITVIVNDLVEKADYSKDWDTALHATIRVTSLCFEFPLPQNEG
jgi:hypothetical protein